MFILFLLEWNGRRIYIETLYPIGIGGDGRYFQYLYFSDVRMWDPGASNEEVGAEGGLVVIECLIDYGQHMFKWPPEVETPSRVLFEDHMYGRLVNEVISEEVLKAVCQQLTEARRRATSWE